MQNKKLELAIHYGVLLILLYLIIFLKLGSFHMRWWDESMFAVNTYEMLQNGNYFTLYFDQQPDLFNTKPPFTVWVQLFFVKLFGYNELALRLPSALAAAGTILMIFQFISDYFDKVKGWIAALVLLTSFGFINFHTARTADADAMVCFFLTAGNLYFARYLLSEKRKYILLVFIFLLLAFATKLYAAFLFGPALLFLLIYKKQFKKFILNWQFAVGLGLFLLFGFLLIYFRVQKTPSYLDLIISKDAGRIFDVVEKHSGPPLFYIENFFNFRFAQWFTITVLGGIIVVYSQIQKQKEIGLIFAALLVSYLAIIMISVTKLDWYDMPLFPILSFFTAVTIYFILQHIKNKGKALSTQKQYIIIGLLFIYPFIVFFNKSQGNTIKHGEIQLESKSIFLFNAIKKGQNMDGLKVYHHQWKGSLLFYKYRLETMNQNISITNNIDNIQPNDRVLVSNDSLEQVLQNHYHLKKIDGIFNAHLFEVKK